MSIAAFRVRSFRFQWSADLLTSWAFEMETIILGWYVMVHTGSVLLLTLFGSLQFLGTLVAPMFGVLGDRLGGRFMLCAMRATYATLAALMMVLILAGLLSPVAVFAVATLAGIVRPNDLVMRNSLIGETIPPAHFMGALGLSRATMDSARVGGALAGAGLSTILGLASTYVVVMAFYLAGVALTLGVARRRPMPDPTAPARVGLPRSSRWHELRAGVVHVLKTPELLAGMWLAFLVNLTAYWNQPLAALVKENVLYFSPAYRPIGALFYQPMFALIGFSPLPYRIFCFLLLTGNLGLMWLAIRSITGSPEIEWQAT